MLFDKMCKAAEDGCPALAKSLRYASLVRMPGKYVGAESSVADFRMLWKAMAIEDDEGCVFLERLGTAGKGLKRVVDDSARSTTSDVGLVEGDALAYAITTPDTTIVGVLVIGPSAPPNNGWVNGTPTAVPLSLQRISGIGSPENLLAHSDSKLVVSGVLTDLFVAFRQCVLAAQPGTWVLKERVSSRIRDPKTSPKIPRSGDRHRWIVISDKERTRYFRNQSEARSSDGMEVTPHPRRAHFRRIGVNEDGSPRYTWVRACWVGSTEAEIRGAHYTVELDL